MTIRKKAEDSKRDAIIDKGGEVAADKQEAESVRISFMIPKSLLKDVDDRVKLRPWMSRTTWMCEALSEKLTRE